MIELAKCCIGGAAEPYQSGRVFRLLAAVSYSLHGLFLLVVPAVADPVFVDVTTQAGFVITHGEGLTNDEMMTGGAAVADFDGDGWVDLVVTRYGGHPLLYRNRGDGSFDDVSDGSGITMPGGANGAGWADIDNDGDPDLYLTQCDRRAVGDRSDHRLFVNDGTGKFSEEAFLRGAALRGRSRYGTSVAFGDYDRDGWIDIHVCEWGSQPFPISPAVAGMTRLLRNRGAAAPGHFEDVTESAGVSIEGLVGYGPVEGDMPGNWAFSSRFTDLDGDGWPDLVIAGDFSTSRLFWNDGAGGFVDGTVDAGVGTDENGMGLAVADYDGDGRLDIFVTSIFQLLPPGERPVGNWGISGNRLFRNLGGRVFDDTTAAAGVRDGDWGWGASFGDFDNDGRLDLAMTNGFAYPPAEEFVSDPSRLFQNVGGGVFEDVSRAAGIVDTGSGKGLLTFDFDRDGDLDIFIVNNAGLPVLYRNDQATANNWLKVRLRGRTSNRDGVGAKLVLALDGGETFVREVDGGSNYLSQNERTIHFGLGTYDGGSPTLTVWWPSGLRQVLHGVPVDRELSIVEDRGADAPRILGVELLAGEGRVNLNWSARPGRFYAVEVSDGAGGWRRAPSAAGSMALGNQMTGSLPVSSGAPSCMFRVVEWER